jgi:hypothetical protein
MIVCTPFVKVCLLVAAIVGVLSFANALAQTAPNVACSMHRVSHEGNSEHRERLEAEPSQSS